MVFRFTWKGQDEGTGQCQLPQGLTACWSPSQTLCGLMRLQVVSMDCWLEILVPGPPEATHTRLPDDHI